MTRIPFLRGRGGRVAAAFAGVAAFAITTTVFSAPASATEYLRLVGGPNEGQYVCKVTTYGVITANWPVNDVENNCNGRVWLHQQNPSGGWSFCVSPNTNASVPTARNHPFAAQITANNHAC